MGVKGDGAVPQCAGDLLSWDQNHLMQQVWCLSMSSDSYMLGAVHAFVGWHQLCGQIGALGGPGAGARLAAACLFCLIGGTWPVT